ncbi:MAG: hypothetical protein ACREQ2_08915 [Candidatus Binatia bacterium]
MKKTTRKRREEKSMESRNCLTILALVTEMARRLNENISKVQLKPLDVALGSAASRPSALAGVDTSAA